MSTFETNDYIDYTNNDSTINIERNEDFIDHPAVTTCGDGTEENPYIIQSWRVKKIIIKNTNVFFEIKDCFLYDGYPIYFFRVTNGKIDNCLFEKDKGFKAIELKWSTNILIKNCIINNYLHAFYLNYYSNNNLIDNCEINDLGNQNEAFILDSSNYNEIKNCNINEFDTYGFRLVESSNNNIHHCKIKNGGWYGFELYMSNQNQIKNCDVTECLEGIRLERCNNNQIYYNNFYNNEETNVYTSLIGANIWDDGEIGNYWDDYSGKDNDNDGIGDSSYNIASDEKDNFPLKQSYETPFPPNVTGRPEGWFGKAYDYTFMARDLDSNNIHLYIDWGDSNKEWYGPFKTDEEIKITHIYNKYGKYDIRAKARDMDGNKGNWGGVFRVTMPKSKLKRDFSILDFILDLLNINRGFFENIFFM